MIRCFILLLYACTIFGIGYDAGGGDRATCGRPYRAGRRYQPPCDLNRYGYCSQAGQLYPWRAVRRFVKDNQGLMKRMYGDQRHGHVLKTELEDPEEFDEEDGNNNWKPTQVRFARYQHENDDIDNELDDFDDIDDMIDEGRYFRGGSLTNDDVLNTKFVISEQEAAIAIKLAELKASAHFRRPASHRSQYTTQKYHLTTPAATATTQKSTTTTEKSKITTTETNEEAATQKSTTKTTAEVEITEEAALIAVSTTTTEDTSTTETTTTTDRTTEWLSKKITTTTPIISTNNSTDEGISVKLNSEGMDQTVESSENSEVYSEQLKQIENTPAMLFQDMDDGANNSNKKKVPMNFNKMKGVNACPVKEEVVAPFWANNTRGEVLALLNMYPFEQYVHWEKCTFENRQMYCREGCRCEQQYRLHRLLAYDPNNECRGIFSDWFRFPSCCVCKCYDIPPEFRVTSRSPRFEKSNLGEEEEYNNSS